MAYKLPKYDTTKVEPLGGFLRELRQWLYGSEKSVADATGFNRTTVIRWEKNGAVSPDVRGYLAFLTRENVNRFGREYYQEWQKDLAEELLIVVNDVITKDERLSEKGIEAFNDWAELNEEADMFLAAKQSNRRTPTSQKAQQEQAGIARQSNAEQGEWLKTYESWYKERLNRLEEHGPVILPDRVFERVTVDQFEGREWLKRSIHDFLEDQIRDRGVWLLTGEAGIGKTSFLARLVKEEGYINFFAELAPGDANLTYAVRSLAAQIIDHFHLDPSSEPNLLPPDLSQHPLYLDQILRVASSKLAANEQLVIVIDALDEAGVASGGNVLGLPRSLPKGVYLLMSQRSIHVDLDIEPLPYCIDLRAEDIRNQRDITSYLQKRAQEHIVTEHIRANHLSSEDFVRVLSEKCEGNWMYLSCVISDIRAGLHAGSDYEDLPPGLIGYYGRYWRRWRNMQEWDLLYAPILAVLAASLEPISIRMLKVWADCSATDYVLERLLCEEWSPFIQEIRRDESQYRLRPSSLRDFLRGMLDISQLQPSYAALTADMKERVDAAEQHFVQTLYTSVFSAIDEGNAELHIYAYRHLAEHLRHLQWIEKLYALVENQAWRKKKRAFDPSGYSLASDFAIAIGESREAVAHATRHKKDARIIFQHLEVFCAHSLYASTLETVAKNLPADFLGVLAFLGEVDKAWGYAHLHSSTEAYKFVLDGLEAGGHADQTEELRQHVQATLQDRIRTTRLELRFDSEERESASKSKMNIQPQENSSYAPGTIFALLKKEGVDQTDPLELAHVSRRLLEEGAISTSIEVADRALAIARNIISMGRVDFMGRPMEIFAFEAKDTLLRLVAIYAAVGNLDKATALCKEILSVIKKSGFVNGPFKMPEGAVNMIALYGAPAVVVRAAREVLGPVELSDSMWSTAERLMENGRIAEALELIDDGELPLHANRHTGMHLLAQSTLWLVRNKQYERAQTISKIVIGLAEEAVIPINSMALFLGGIALGLKQAQLSEMASAVAEQAIAFAKDLDTLRWRQIDTFIELVAQAGNKEQVHEFAEWLLQAVDEYEGKIETSEHTNMKEEWVDLLRLCALIYAWAGEVNKAIATIDKHGDLYGRGRRYLYSLGLIALTLERAGFYTQSSEIKPDIQKFAELMLDVTENELKSDPHDAYWNGHNTDAIVTLARIGLAKQALIRAWKIKDQYYRTLTLGAVSHDLTLNNFSFQALAVSRIDLLDAAATSLRCADDLNDSTRDLIIERCIKTIARLGELEYAETATRDSFASYLGINLDTEGQVQHHDKEKRLRSSSADPSDLISVLPELVEHNSYWSVCVIANLFLTDSLSIWKHLGYIGPAFAHLGVIKQFWERIERLWPSSEELE